MLATCWGNLFFHTGFEQWAIYWKPDRKASARLKTNRAPHLANGAVWEVWVNKKGLVCVLFFLSDFSTKWLCFILCLISDFLVFCLSPQVSSRNQTWLALWNSKASTINWKNWLLESCLKEFLMEFKEETWELSAGKLHLSSRVEISRHVEDGLDRVLPRWSRTLQWKTYSVAFIAPYQGTSEWPACVLQRSRGQCGPETTLFCFMAKCRCVTFSQNLLLTTFHPASLQR